MNYCEQANVITDKIMDTNNISPGQTSRKLIISLIWNYKSTLFLALKFKGDEYKQKIYKAYVYLG